MEFITLQAVLDGIAATVQSRPYVCDPVPDKLKDSEVVLAAREFWETQAPELDNARRFSEAAKKLNKALHHDAKPPQWMQYDKVKGFAVPAESIGAEGLDLLTHATGWCKREIELSAEHVRDCGHNGWDPRTLQLTRNMNDGLTPAGSFFRIYEIGFERAELVAFLEGKIDHDLKAQDTTPSAAPVVTESVPDGMKPAKVGPVSEKPWLVIDPSDPRAIQPWYTPARYFARQLVMEDSTLLQRRRVLAGKVSKSLADTGFKKRGGKLALNSDTVLKAFSNVLLG